MSRELSDDWLGCFVTAKRKGFVDARQGWIVQLGDPFIIEGQTGSFYECEGEPTLVTNPPQERLCLRK